MSEAATVIPTVVLGAARFALISDIHANLPALAAVLDAIPPEMPLVCAGDVVGYYTEPNEVCELLRGRRAIGIRGNHDAYALGLLEYPPSKEPVYRVAWTRDALMPENRVWLASLPTELRLRNPGPHKAGGWSEIQVRHANLLDEESYVYPDSDLAAMQAPAAPVLILGHTHHQMVRSTAGGALIVNPGSVGQPRDRVPEAAYALVDMAHGAILPRRAAYDVTSYQRRLLSQGVSDAMVDLLSRR